MLFVGSDMLKVGLDARMIAHSGIGTYLRGLLREFQDKQNLDLTLYGELEKIIHFPAKKISASFPIYSIREQFFFPSLLKKNMETNLHVPHYNAPLGFTGNLLVTIHDLIHLRYPPSKIAYFYARTMFEAICRKAKMIIAVSEMTKRDILKFLGVSEKKVRVIYHGAGTVQSPVSLNQDTPLEKRNRRGGDYLLYVGMLKPHKNIPVLIEAFLRAKKRIQELKLVLAGKNFMPTLTELYRKEDGIQFLGEVSQNRLAQLYSNARVFILPSLYEGFGFPLLEAMSYGVPVIASNSSSLPEVAGDAALFFNPANSQELAERIWELWENSKLQEELVRKGHERAKRFSWERCAEETIKVYEECFS